MSLSKSFFWSAVERFSTQIVQFVIGIILARILSPKEYGIIGILLVINSFLQIFIDSGFSKALIQKKDRSTLDYNSVFVFNIALGFFFYFILYFSTPFIEGFYEIPNLSFYARVLGLSVIINAFYTVIQTDLIIKLNFKSIAIVNLISSLVSGVIAVFMAVYDYGIWALILQTIIKSLVSLIIYFIVREVNFNLSFSFLSIKKLYNFGSNILYSSLLNTLVNNFSTIFIAKIFNTQSVGFYTRGTQFTDVAFNTFSSILDNVLLPTFSKLSDDLDEVKLKFIKIFRFTVILIWPFFLLLAVLAEPIIKLLLTDKWLMAVPIMQIFAISRFITLLSGININVLYAYGRSDLALKQQVIKIVIRVILIAVAIPFGIYYVALAELISTIIHYFINTYYPGKILNISGWRQIASVYKELILFSIIFITMNIATTIIIQDNLLNILLTISSGGILYVIVLRKFYFKEVQLDFYKKLIK